MQSYNIRFNQSPADGARKEMETVYKKCISYDKSDISSGLSSGDSADSFLIVKDSTTGSIVSYCAVFEGDDYISVNVFIDPIHRRRRIFTTACSRLVSRYPGLRICFPAHEAHSAIRHMVSTGFLIPADKQLLMSVSADFICSSHDTICIEETRDLALIGRLHSNIFSDFTPGTSACYSENVMSMPETHAFIFSSENKICGMSFVLTERENCLIFGFGILPEYRRRGLGRKCLSALYELLKKDADRLCIKVQVDARNMSAIALYRRCGFKEESSYCLFAIND